MKFTLGLAALLVLPASAVWGQDAPKNPRRLDSVTWDSVKHELTWVVSNGEKKTGGSNNRQQQQDGHKGRDDFKAVSQEKYIIDMDNATMTYQGETRRFSPEEAKRVHTLMDLISKYAVESTVWWEDGQGEKVDGKESPTPSRRVAVFITPCPDRLSNLLLAYSPVPNPHH